MYLFAHSNDLENIIAQCRYANAKGAILTKEGYAAVIGETGYMISGNVFSTDRDIVISLPELTRIASISRRLEMKLPDGQLVLDEAFLEYSITLTNQQISVSGTHHVAKYTTNYELAEASVVNQVKQIVEMEPNRRPDFVVPVMIFKQLTKKYKSNIMYHTEGEVLIMSGEKGRMVDDHFAGFSNVKEIPQIPRKSLRGLELITKPVNDGLILFYLMQGMCHVVVERNEVVLGRTRMELPLP